MQIFRGLIAFVVFLTNLTGPAFSQSNSLALPSVEDVRAAYAAMPQDWMPIPERVLMAVVAEESPDFFASFPVRSPITYQVAKDLGFAFLQEGTFRPPRTTISRRIFHFRLQIILANALNHEQILLLYSNTIYVGRGCHGLYAGSAHHFGKEPAELDVSELALMIAAIKVPSVVDANRGELALQRRNGVLDNMVEQRVISEEEADLARQEDVLLDRSAGYCSDSGRPVWWHFE